MNAFLPTGYEPPAASGGNYLKLAKNSEARIRIVSQSPILGWEYWTEDNKPRRLRERPTMMPADVRTGEDGNPEKLRHFWAMAVFDYADSAVKIWEITQATIQRTIADLSKDEDWGHPSGYDLKIKRDDSTGRTTYTVAPVPHKPLNDAIKRIVAEAHINLDALFSGDDPFASAPVITQATPVTQAPPQLPEGVHKALHAAGQSFYGSQWDTKRHELVRAVTKGRAESSNDLTLDEATRLIDGIHRAADKAAAEAVQAPEADEPF